MSCIALDASAFFHARDMRVFAGPLYTTRQVVEELKDPMAQAALEILRVEVVEVDQKKVEEVRKKFKDLSAADASLLVLAMERRCVLVTDDRKLAAVAKRLGVRVEGIFYR
jgi:Predicted nucleic acid-binding protein, consists of a PIN domain and a Zn-ribbon module